MKSHDKKNMAKQFYTNGKRDKVYENYFDNGSVFKRAFLRHGYIDNLQTFDSLGKLVETKHFEDVTWSFE